MPQTTTSGGTRLYYRLEGDPAFPPLVLLHPIGADSSIWDKVVPRLLGRFRILRPDLRGHGGSSAPGGDYTLDQLLADLLELTAALHIDRFLLAGISLGGMTALQAALKAPERIRGVVVCSAAPVLSPPPGGWDGRARAALTSGMEPLAGPMVERMFSAAYRDTNDHSVHTARTVFARMDPAGYASACAVLRDTDITASLSLVSPRVLVISGEKDPLVPPAAGKRMADNLPRAIHKILAGGHFPPLESAGSFAREVLAFESSLGA